MPRFFCKQTDIKGGIITIQEHSSVHHLRDVLRIKPKGNIVVCDEQRHEYECVIESIADEVVARITNKRVTQKKHGNITVACAIPKNALMDDIVDKLTQLGVDRIIPMLTKRVIVKLDAQKGKVKQERWQKIAREASKQSQRVQIPQVDAPVLFEKIVSGAGRFNLKLIPTLSGERKTLNESLRDQKGAWDILVCIGPEGDFTPEEVALAKGAGFIPVALGENVLRVDTAAIAVVSYLVLNENR